MIIALQFCDPSRSDLFVTPSDIDHGPENPGNGIFVDGAKQQPAARAAVAADNNGIAARGVRLPDSNGGVSDNRRAREVEVRHTPPPPSPPPYVEHVEAPPDFRDPVCPAFVDRIRGSGAVLPNTSVIFCFCNEPRSSLYHSIHSVIDRSPQHLLHEIILVDDGSDAPHLQQPLEDYVVCVLHNVCICEERREGVLGTVGISLPTLPFHSEYSLYNGLTRSYVKFVFVGQYYNVLIPGKLSCDRSMYSLPRVYLSRNI